MPLYRYRGNVIFFVHIPKTGGTSIEAALRAAGAAEALRFKGKRDFSKSTLQHMNYSVYKEAIGSDFYDWSFTIVRNPYSRFASEYKMKVLDAGGTESLEDWARQNIERFGQFKFTRDNHIRPQHEFVSQQLTIYRFEDGLSQPLEEAVARLGLPAPEIAHAKRGSFGRVHATKDAVAMLGDFYAEDFRRFGYDRDDYEAAFKGVG